MGTEINTTELANAIDIDVKNITRYLKSLAEQGTIERRTENKGKLRFVFVKLTSRNNISTSRKPDNTSRNNENLELSGQETNSEQNEISSTSRKDISTSRNDENIESLDQMTELDQNNVTPTSRNNISTSRKPDNTSRIEGPWIQDQKLEELEKEILAIKSQLASLTLSRNGNVVSFGQITPQFIEFGRNSGVHDFEMVFQALTGKRLNGNTTKSDQTNFNYQGKRILDAFRQLEAMGYKIVEGKP